MNWKAFVMGLFIKNHAASQKDIGILARTIWGEARGEDTIGKQAVANVVLNRAAEAYNHPHFGDGTLAGACQAPWQFSCMNDTDPNKTKLLAVTAEDPVFAECQQIASDAANGLLEDNTGGATYYKVIGTYAPWAEGKSPCFVHGHHEFYRNIA